MAGGDLSEATLVSERYLLDLEEKLSCLYVLKEKHWKESTTQGKPFETKISKPKRGIRECKSKYFNLKSFTLGSPGS
jgi:hypothetical protein